MSLLNNFLCLIPLNLKNLFPPLLWRWLLYSLISTYMRVVCNRWICHDIKKNSWLNRDQILSKIYETTSLLLYTCYMFFYRWYLINKRTMNFECDFIMRIYIKVYLKCCTKPLFYLLQFFFSLFYGIQIMFSSSCST